MRYKKNKQIIIIGVIGILALTIAFFVKYFTYSNDPCESTWPYQFIYDAIFNIAFVLVGVFIADIVWSLVGGDPSAQFRETLLHSNTLLSDSVKSGVVGIYSSSSDMGSSKDWLNIIKTATQEICLQGYTLLVWTRSAEFDKTILDLAEKGVDIRFIFMDENALYLNAGINESYISELSANIVKEEIVTMTEYMDNLIEQFNRIEVKGKGSISYTKVKKNLITSQIVIADGTAYITPYMSFFNTSHCPLYKIENQESELYKKYRTEFCKMWECESAGRKSSLESNSK